MQYIYTKNGVTLKLIRETRKKRKDNKHLLPCLLRWRVTYDRKSVYYSTNVYFDIDDWELFKKATDYDFQFKTRIAGHLKGYKEDLEQSFEIGRAHV